MREQRRNRLRTIDEIAVYDNGTVIEKRVSLVENREFNPSGLYANNTPKHDGSGGGTQGNKGRGGCTDTKGGQGQNNSGYGRRG